MGGRTSAFLTALKSHLNSTYGSRSISTPASGRSERFRGAAGARRSARSEDRSCNHPGVDRGMFVSRGKVRSSMTARRATRRSSPATQPSGYGLLLQPGTAPKDTTRYSRQGDAGRQSQRVPVVRLHAQSVLPGAARHPDIEARHHHVDAMALDLVRRPWTSTSCRRRTCLAISVRLGCRPHRRNGLCAIG